MTKVAVDRQSSIFTTGVAGIHDRMTDKVAAILDIVSAWLGPRTLTESKGTICG